MKGKRFYIIAQYKSHKTACNETKTANILKREFEQKKAKRFVVSDLTYVKVQNKWHYICVLVDLFNREIIGHSAGKMPSLCGVLLQVLRVIYVKFSGFIRIAAVSLGMKQ